MFADMEELGVRPDEDTVRRVACAFQELSQEEKKELILRKYQCKWKYIHFKGERIRVRRDLWAEDDRLTKKKLSLSGEEDIELAYWGD